jgi:thiamine-phosphate pyrophosphorylase
VVNDCRVFSLGGEAFRPAPRSGRELTAQRIHFPHHYNFRRSSVVRWLLMPDRCLLYYITDRTQLSGGENVRLAHLRHKIASAARAGVDYIQLREKDLSARELEELAREVVSSLQKLKTSKWQVKTRLLINSRVDVAIACGADGVHLRSDDISPATVRSIWAEAKARVSQSEADEPLIAVSCHTAAEVERAASEGADFAVFAPVFEKSDRPDQPAAGLAALRDACSAKIPVLALGGVTWQNAASCLDAGAAGVAGIRLFQKHMIREVIRVLRAL